MATQNVVITAPNFEWAKFDIVGLAPLVMNKFSQKAREQMMKDQEAGHKKKKGEKKEPKDFNACYEGAIHRSTDGWIGMPCAAFRNAMISACRLVGFKMTLTKLAVFIEPDGFDEDEGTPLIKIGGEPRKFESYVRNVKGIDIRIRPQFLKWSARISVRFDADTFSFDDIANLMMRAGLQVGIGEGRPDSKMSAGQGWGLFSI